MKFKKHIRSWRWILLGTAAIIITGSLWYTNLLVKKMKTEEERKVRIWAEAIERRVGLVNYTDDYFERLKNVERQRVTLWAEAIQQKAKLVNYTNEFFEKISNEERKRVEIWAEANRIVSRADTAKELSFYLQILAGNTTIPIVITDEHGNIRTAANVDFDLSETKKLSGELKREFSYYAPIVSDNFGLINVIYYKESKLYSELRAMLDELTESFISDIVENAASVPVLITDTSKTEVITYGNIEEEMLTKEKLPILINKMAQENPPIEIALTGRTKNFVFYENSFFYKSLKEILDSHIQKFIEEVVTNSTAVPVLITDSTKTEVTAFGGGLTSTDVNTPEKIESLVKTMTSQNNPIDIKLPGQDRRYILYKDSTLLTQVRYYPIVQFLIIGVFILAIYVLLNVTRRSEQDQVWAGMAKEAAHQLGTPISSLMAWLELLKMKQANQPITDEIIKDVKRLEVITERFSKIGSMPALVPINLFNLINESVDYMKMRTSNKIKYSVFADEKLKNTEIPVNKNLFQWVIENLLRNSVDAIVNDGKINVHYLDQGRNVVIDVEDNGKGIPKSKFNMIFMPGYSTKKRGWGLGLSLSKRIIKNYHKGKIFVKSSVIDKGTTFRVILKKQQ